MKAVEPDLVIFSDVSLSGWGAVMNGSTARGPWATEDRSRHKNELELLAAYFGLTSFANNARRISIRLAMDNITAVNYVNKSGGTKSDKLNEISSRISQWAEIRLIHLHAVYIPGNLNIEADQQSQMRSDLSDWQLNQAVFKLISTQWCMSIDLFSSAWNRQLETWVSWQPQPLPHSVDAFSLDWSQW